MICNLFFDKISFKILDIIVLNDDNVIYKIKKKLNKSGYCYNRLKRFFKM